jgi:hypothetical protein
MIYSFVGEMKTITKMERRHISSTERGQTIQLRLSVVYMHAKDVI